MRSRRHSTEEAEVYIDMTPMLDFVLNLLIFFIVTSAYVKITGIDINTPNAETSREQRGGNIFIGITAKGHVWIDKREVDMHSVRAHVARLKAETPDAAVVIQSDEDANTGTLVAVMDQVRMAGIEKIAVAAKRAGPAQTSE
jgi:biopolymer transport protein ExbD